DQYKLTLGLPPHLPVVLDDSLLKPFQLAAPELVTIQSYADVFFAGYREREQVPGLDDLRSGFVNLAALEKRSAAFFGQVAAELENWRRVLATGVADPTQARR